MKIHGLPTTQVPGLYSFSGQTKTPSSWLLWLRQIWLPWKVTDSSVIVSSQAETLVCSQIT